MKIKIFVLCVLTIAAIGLFTYGQGGFSTYVNCSNGPCGTFLNQMRQDSAVGGGGIVFATAADVSRAFIRLDNAEGGSNTGSDLDFGMRVDSGGAGPTALTLQRATGHVILPGGTPSMGSCGSSPSVAGSDGVGTISTSGSVTSCTMNFGNAWTTAPACTLADNITTVTPDVSAVSTSSVTFSFSASLGTSKIYYHCLAYQ